MRRADNRGKSPGEGSSVDSPLRGASLSRVWSEYDITLLSEEHA